MDQNFQQIMDEYAAGDQENSTESVQEKPGSEQTSDASDSQTVIDTGIKPEKKEMTKEGADAVEAEIASAKEEDAAPEPSETKAEEKPAEEKTSGGAETVNVDLSGIIGKTDEITAAVSDSAKKIGELNTRVNTLVSEFHRTVETLKLSLAANQRNEANIHKELEVYKNNQYFMYIKPYLEFMISMLDDLKGSKKDYEKDKDSIVESNTEDIFNEIIGLHDMFIKQLVSQLKIQGVEIISYQPGDKFIPLEQIITKTEPTDDPDSVEKIASAESDCYKFEDKVLKRAKVHVYKRR